MTKYNSHLTAEQARERRDHDEIDEVSQGCGQEVQGLQNGLHALGSLERKGFFYTFLKKVIGSLNFEERCVCEDKKKYRET